MAFEEIDCVRPKSAGTGAVPPKGVAIVARKLGTKTGERRYIKIAIGAELARGISLTQPEHRLRLSFGTGEDAGKIRFSVDNAAGKFLAKRDKRGSYVLTLNAATVDGLFSLIFAPFAIDRCEPLRPTNGQPPHFVMQASAAMLAVEG